MTVFSYFFSAYTPHACRTQVRSISLLLYVRLVSGIVASSPTPIALMVSVASVGTAKNIVACGRSTSGPWR